MNMRTERTYERTHVTLISVLSVAMLIMISDTCGWANTEQLNEFPIVKGSALILLPVKYDGKEHLFLLDTASTYTVYDLSFKKELGDVRKREKAHTSAGQFVLELYDAPEAYLGDHNIAGSGKVACMDLRMLNFILGKKVSGIIGMEFLKKHVIQIDFDKGTLAFLTTEKKQGSVWGEEFVLKYLSDVPYITASLSDGSEVDFMVDTGLNFSGYLDRRLFENLISKQNVQKSESLVYSPTGVSKSRNTRIDKFSIGAFDYEGLIFGEGELNLLGLEFLARHIVTFDLLNDRLYLKKGENFMNADEIDMSGLHLLRISEKTIVHSVDGDSPAYKAGIKSNDVILRVGNKDANMYDMWKLRRFLKSGDKKEVTMKIKSSTDVKEVSFLLEKKI